MRSPERTGTQNQPKTIWEDMNFLLLSILKLAMMAMRRDVTGAASLESCCVVKDVP